MSEDKGKLYPLKFEPFPEIVSWGGTAFVERYGKRFVLRDSRGRSRDLPPETAVGESWELADMGFRDSVVRAGWLAGNTIGELMDMYCDEMTGEEVFSRYGRQFPILVKLLDVEGRTPLLVHPDDEVAAQRYDALGKAKMWYVLDAEAGSGLYMGLRRDVTAAEFYEACLDGTVAKLLKVMTPHRGDVFFIPPGLVHGAYGGVRMVEVAEASDLDFKLCNWGRPTENDPDERLGVGEALDFLDLKAYDAALCNSWKTGPAPRRQDANAVKLVDCGQFKVSRIDLSQPLKVTYAGDASSFAVYVCIEGEADVQVPSSNGGNDSATVEYVVSKGEAILVPADVAEYFLVPRCGGTVLLEAM